MIHTEKASQKFNLGKFRCVCPGNSHYRPACLQVKAPLLTWEKTKTWAGVEVVYKVEIEDIG